LHADLGDPRKYALNMPFINRADGMPSPDARRFANFDYIADYKKRQPLFPPYLHDTPGRLTTTGRPPTRRDPDDTSGYFAGVRSHGGFTV
jgi:hypothetical protein